MFEFLPLVIWLVITVAFAVLELATSIYVLPVAVGGGIAAVASLFQISLLGQIIIFAVVTLLAFVLFRPNRQRGRKGRESDGLDEDIF